MAQGSLKYYIIGGSVILVFEAIKYFISSEKRYLKKSKDVQINDLANCNTEQIVYLRGEISKKPTDQDKKQNQDENKDQSTSSQWVILRKSKKEFSAMGHIMSSVQKHKTLPFYLLQDNNFIKILTNSPSLKLDNMPVINYEKVPVGNVLSLILKGFAEFFMSIVSRGGVHFLASVETSESGLSYGDTISVFGLLQGEKILAEYISVYTKEQILKRRVQGFYFCTFIQLTVGGIMVYKLFNRFQGYLERRRREQQRIIIQARPQIQNVVQEDQINQNLDKESGQNQCVICMDQLREVIHMPCKHFSTCRNCDQNIDRCPICRQRITDKMIVHNAWEKLNQLNLKVSKYQNKDWLTKDEQQWKYN